jgi:nitronate monooxygenase
MGCDLAYLGTRFIATRESNAADRYKQMIAAARAADILYTPYFSGVHGSYLKASVRAAGLDPDNLPAAPAGQMNYDRREERPKAWKDIWGAGQGVGNIADAPPVAELVDRLEREYCAARARFAPAQA